MFTSTSLDYFLKKLFPKEVSLHAKSKVIANDKTFKEI